MRHIMVSLIVVIAEECKRRLLGAGYTHLRESEEWKIEAGGKYFFTRNLSTISAFSVGKR